MPMRFRSLALLIALAGTAAPARANDIRIYHGTVVRDFFTTMNAELSKQRIYLIVDHTALQIGFVLYDPKERTHSETVVDTTFDTIRPSAADPGAQQFIYAGAPEASGTPVDVYRLRSVGKLTLQPISSSASERVAKRLAYASYHVALSLFNEEQRGTFKYQKKLTIAANDIFHDMATAIALVLDDLRARDVID
jgi:hypothetical protein